MLFGELFFERGPGRMRSLDHQAIFTCMFDLAGPAVVAGDGTVDPPGASQTPDKSGLAGAEITRKGQDRINRECATERPGDGVGLIGGTGGDSR